MQNAECRIEVFPSEIIEMSPQSGHLYFAFIIHHFALKNVIASRGMQ